MSTPIPEVPDLEPVTVDVTWHKGYGSRLSARRGRHFLAEVYTEPDEHLEDLAAAYRAIADQLDREVDDEQERNRFRRAYLEGRP